MRIVKRLTDESEAYWPAIGMEGDNCFWDAAVLSDKNAEKAVTEGVAEFKGYKDEVASLIAYNEAKGTSYKCTATPADPTKD
jgi:hypothetical protein